MKTNSLVKGARIAALLGTVLWDGACRGRPEAVPADAGGTSSPQGAPPAMEPQVVVTVGGSAIPYGAFERYLADNSAQDEGTMDEQADTIKSRLLDQFIEEQLLVRAAGRFKVTVSDAEVDQYMQALGVSQGEAEVAGPEGKEAFRDKLRQSILIQKVKDEAVLSKVEITPGEIEDYFNKHPDQYRQPRAVVLRQILVDDKALAERLAADLSKDPSRFEAVARDNSVSPDRGQARTYTEEELPVELREPLFALQPGQVSPPLEQAQRWRIFQLVRKSEAQAGDLAGVRRRIQLELFQAKSDQALDQFIADLKKESDIRVNRTILPFDYLGEYRR